jgi:steroid delta-isomerase-like uncharacterized protein
VYSAFNARKFDDAVKLAAPRLEWRDIPSGEILQGPDGMRQNLERWAGAFNDAKVEVKRVTATENVVVAEFIGRGTHTGPLVTPTGMIAATHRKTEVPFCDVVTVENGRITSIASYYDAATILQQLGVHELAGTGSHR